MVNIVVKLAIPFSYFFIGFSRPPFFRDYNRNQKLLYHLFMEVDEYNFLFLGLNLPLENSSLPGVSFCNVSVARLTSLPCTG